MSPQTFILLGASGSGKGTQANLLQEHLTKRDPDHRIFYLQTGDLVRAFVKGDGYSNKLSMELEQAGKLQPQFLAVYLWVDAFIKNIQGVEHIILDGSPRRLEEAVTFDTAVKFYKRVKPQVIYIRVSKEWSKARLTARGREDDKRAMNIEERLRWFDTEVIPVIEYYRNNPDYHFVEVNGEQAIEAVHRDLVAGISFS